MRIFRTMGSTPSENPPRHSGYVPFAQFEASSSADSQEVQMTYADTLHQNHTESAQLISQQPSGEDSDRDIVQFSAPIYYAKEDEHKVEIDIMRLGTVKGRVVVAYATEDGSAQADKKYKTASGILVFEDGEFVKTILVDLIDDEIWSPTLEFKVRLSHPQNCDLGASMQVARVKIIDDDCFPSNIYKDLIGSGHDVDDAIDQISPQSLFWSYMKWNYNAGGIRWRTLAVVGLDQLHNAYLYYKMWVTIFIVDTLFSDAVPESTLFMGSRVATSGLLALGYVLPMFILHFWDVLKTKLNIEGLTCSLLQQSLFRKYLNLSEDSRVAVLNAEIVAAITDDSKSAAEGYVSLLNMVKTISKFAILMYFVLQESPGALMYVVVMPLLMVSFALYFQAWLTPVEEELGEHEATLVSLIQQISSKYRLIADYSQRPRMTEIFAKDTKKLQDTEIKQRVILRNMNFIPVWIGSICTGLYICLNAKYVGQALSTGAFVATINIISEVAEDFTDLYSQLLSMKTVTSAIFNLTRLFNLSTDLNDWKAVNHARKLKTRQIREELFNGTSPLLQDNKDSVQFKTDLIPIEITRMDYEYPHSGKGVVLTDVQMSVPQGRLVAVVGPHGSGKSTLLKLLGQCMFPTRGSIFIPNHLRILHVTQEPLLLEMPPLQNLLFGGPNDSENTPQRVRAILERLEMQFLSKFVEKDLQHWERSFSNGRNAPGNTDHDVDSLDEIGHDHSRLPWYTKLTHTEMVKIHLARALIMNPEVIVFHRLFSHFATEKAKSYLSALKEHIDNRGLMLPRNTRHRRRPRTAFFVPENVSEAKFADVVWQVDARKAHIIGSDVYEVSPDQLAEDFQPMRQCSLDLTAI